MDTLTLTTPNTEGEDVRHAQQLLAKKRKTSQVLAFVHVGA
jgi:hypothetical protein